MFAMVFGGLPARLISHQYFQLYSKYSHFISRPLVHNFLKKKFNKNLILTLFTLHTHMLLLVCCFYLQLGCSDMEKLVVLTMFYGGKMQRMLDSTVTHLVTMDTSGVSTIRPSYSYPLSGLSLKYGKSKVD